ncbi:MAG: hypothetical protein SNI54_05365 [Rikenellaceae bacterium]
MRKLNDEIANETKNTVLADFDTELQTRLQGARSVLEMLNILEEKRKALANDGSFMFVIENLASMGDPQTS